MPTPSRPSPADGLHSIAELARRSLGCKAAVVRVSYPGTGQAELCAAAVQEADDGRPGELRQDPCTLSDPLTADDLGFRFYAGIPLRTPGGETVGVLAAVDPEPRELAASELDTLNLLAAVAVELAQARFAGKQ